MSRNKEMKIESLIEELLNTHIEENEYLSGRYHFSTICKKWRDGSKLRRSYTTGLFPIGLPEDEVIKIKYLKGNKKRAGAVATIAFELEIKEGILADCIRLFNLNASFAPYIFRQYSSSLSSKRLFRDGAISIYPNNIEGIKTVLLEMIYAIEKFFIYPQCLIYNMDMNLLDYIDKNHSLFAYPYLSKLLVYVRNTKNITENELYSLADKRFSDYRYRNQIIKLYQTDFIYNSIHRIIDIH